MARTKVDNKLNVVIGTKAQIEGDTGIPENSIIVVTDEELTASDIPNLEISKITGLQTALDGKVDKNGGIPVDTWNGASWTPGIGASNRLFICTGALDQTVILPTNATAPFPIGTMITFLLTGTHKVTFTGESGVDIMSMNDLVELKTQYGMASVIKVFENTWQLVGALE